MRRALLGQATPETASFGAARSAWDSRSSASQRARRSLANEEDDEPREWETQERGRRRVEPHPSAAREADRRDAGFAPTVIRPYCTLVRRPSPLPIAWRRAPGAGCRGQDARPAP